jgi:hypothetical protein
VPVLKDCEAATTTGVRPVPVGGSPHWACPAVDVLSSTWPETEGTLTISSGESVATICSGGGGASR